MLRKKEKREKHCISTGLVASLFLSPISPSQACVGNGSTMMEGSGPERKLRRRRGATAAWGGGEGTTGEGGRVCQGATGEGEIGALFRKYAGYLFLVPFLRPREWLLPMAVLGVASPLVRGSRLLLGVCGGRQKVQTRRVRKGSGQKRKGPCKTTLFF